ncbi:response regulator transcription factor [Thalassorhabdus alkalitolerans]|uniref:Response regulator transcription factor n=1 Tax=Thalassorhabdus alkalitolerans TaxID=2282697 RepID=A0ABW0YK88_9BACI
MGNRKILIVDDEWSMRNLLKIYLHKEGFDYSEATNGKEALQTIGSSSFEVIVLDLMMPDMDGIEVCKKIRDQSDVPILMLTARKETKDKVEGLNMGADDYLTKPFEPEELVARINSLIRRKSTSILPTVKEKVLKIDGLTIDHVSRKVIVHQSVIEVTPKEFDLLYLLANHPERVYTRENILDIIWEGDFIGYERTVDTHVKSIRSKLRKAGLPFNPIETVWGVGYKFNPGHKQ